MTNKIKEMTQEEWDRLHIPLKITKSMKMRYRELLKMIADNVRKGGEPAIITRTIGTDGRPLNWIFWAEPFYETEYDPTSKLLGIGLTQNSNFGGIPFQTHWLKPKMFKYFSFEPVTREDLV